MKKMYMLNRQLSLVRSVISTGVRFQSKEATTTAAAATAAVPANVNRTPLVPTAEHAKNGDVVTVPWNRFNVENTDFFDVAEARRVATLSYSASVLKGREATIYRVTQSAMTSGQGAAKWWGIRLDHTGDKWTSQLMGWTSSSDTAQQIQLLTRFENPEQAILFCERIGLKYRVNPEREVVKGTVDSQYAYNFLPTEVQTRMKAGGPRRARHIFHNPTSPSATGCSTFVNYRYTQRGNEEWKPRTDGTYEKGVPQTATAWTGEEWAAAKLKGGDAEHH